MSGRPSTRSRREPGISSWITRAVLLELESRGLDATPLLARRGLRRVNLLDPDGWIPQRSHAGFYRDAIAASGDPAFAVAVGRRAPLHLTRIAGHCAAVSSDVREAFETWAQFSALVGDGTSLWTRSMPEHDAVHWRRLPALPPLHDDEVSFAASALDFLAFAAGVAVHPIEIRFTGAATGPAAPLEKALGAPIRWSSDHLELRLPPGTLDLPIRFSGPSLRALLARSAQETVSIRNGETTSERVRAAILQIGFARTGNMAEVSRKLGQSTRTLQRSLAGEGLTYSRLRSEVLRDSALAMLTEEGATIAEVAFRLGFSSRSSFHHAMKRWTGKRPGELRAAASARRTS